MAQESNDTINKDMIINHMNSIKSPSAVTGSLMGVNTANLDENGDSLRFQTPVVSYHRADKQTFVREIKTNVRSFRRDSLVEDKELVYSDTLTKKELIQVRKQTSGSFKGKSPFLFNSLYLPIIGITSGLAAIFTLFYLRSPAQ